MWCAQATGLDDGRNTPFASVEVDYLSGLERLNDPTPVRIVVDADGVTVSELMPGTRTTRIPSQRIIGALALANTAVAEPEPELPNWLRSRREVAAAPPIDHGHLPEETRGHALKIRYRDGDEIKTAVFKRDDAAGFSLIDRIARSITSQARIKTRQSL
jgi:hypothetical protein